MALFLIVGAALLAYLLWGRPAARPLATVQRGELHSTVNASGEVVAVRQAQISSRVAGEIVAVPVTVGQEVLSGTVLVTMASDALQYRARDAALRLEVARLRLEQARGGALPEEVAAAQADLDLARARLAQVQAGASPQDVALARQDVVQAEAALEQTRQSAAVAVETARLSWETAGNALRDAQDAYSRVYWENERLRQQGIPVSQAQQDAEAAAWRRVQDAEAAMEQARLAHERALEDQRAGMTTAEARLQQARTRLSALLTGPTEAEVSQAQAQVDRAQANLDRVRAGALPAEVQIAEAELALAELALAEAEGNVARATVVAPFSGTVLEVGVKPGEVVGAYSALVRLADLDQLEVRARIDEVDVGQVLAGQAVTVTLDAYPGRPLRGLVAEVAPSVTLDRGSAFYLTRITLESIPPASDGQPAITLRLGMAASVTVLAVSRPNVLLVPRQAVERVGQGDYVTVVRGARSERVRVTLGSADPGYYEVISGLQEGDQVQLPAATNVR